MDRTVIDACMFTFESVKAHVSIFDLELMQVVIDGYGHFR